MKRTKISKKLALLGVFCSIFFLVKTIINIFLMCKLCPKNYRKFLGGKIFFAKKSVIWQEFVNKNAIKQ